MVKIHVEDLRDKSKDLSEFLSARLGLKTELLGDTIIAEGTPSGKPLTASSVKPYLKRFLHNQNLRSFYKIAVTKDEIRLKKLETEEKAES